MSVLRGFHHTPNVGYVVKDICSGVEGEILSVLVGCCQPSDIVFGMRRGHTEIRQSLYQCLAYVAQLHDNRTAFKTPQHIPNTARIPLQSRLGQISNVKYYFFSFWANKLRFLAKLPPIVKSELKIAGSF
jgi:hypothetical protein